MTQNRRIGRWWAGGLVPLLAVLCGGTAAAQQVTGTVTSATTGQPLTGVEVTVRGTAVSTRTTAEGRYLINVPSIATDTLVFALIGYRQETAGIAGRSTIDIALDRIAQLEAVVSIGYGEQERRDLTGAIGSVDGEDIAEVATASVAQALQGKIAGVQVTPETGEPGKGAVVRIRGVGTLNNASPLYVVDGMLLDEIGFLSPNDIASIDVLKDASATAIYGSRGANGVIIVTTKKGEESGRTTFTMNAWAGSQSVQNEIDLVSAEQYAELANELAANTGAATLPFPTGFSGAGVDWQDEIFQSAPMQSVQLAAQGGSDRVSYYFSGNLVNQTGIIEKSDFRRATLRLNNDYDLSDRFRLGHSINFAYTEDERAPGVVRQLYYADPTVSPRDAEGTFNDVNQHGGSAGNPAAAVFYTRNEGSGGRLVGNLFADYDVTSDITFRSSFGVDYGRDDFRNFAPAYFVSPTQRNNDSNLRVETNTVSTWLWDNTATYNYNSERHRLTVLGGVTANRSYLELLGGNRVNIAGESPSLWYLNAGASDGQTNENRAEDWAMLSYLARANYTLLDRYLFTASMRVDGSSRFGADNRYGYFPSLALGWNVDEELFFDAWPAFDNLKLRASWGQTGNDKIGSYPGIPLVTGNLNAVFGTSEVITYGAAPIALANPNVKWERTTQTNAGADMAFLDNRLAVTADWFHRLTDGILVQVPIPGYIGVNSQPFVNAAEVLNTGLEGSITWSNAYGDVRYEIGANGSTIDNEVKALGGGREEILGGGLGNEVTFTTRTVVGEPIGSFWGFRTDGVFQNAAEVAAGPRRGGEQPGDIRYADLDGDGAITNADKTFIGSPIPDFIYGLNGSIEWKAFDVSASFTGQMGNEIFNGKKAVRFGYDNFETSFLDRWTPTNPSTTEPRVTNAGHNYQASTRFIEDGSYFKLQTAQLGYRLSEAMAGRMGVDRARLYVSGTNLFTLTDYSGYSPEVNSFSVIASGIDLGIYPTVRTFTVGLDLAF